MKKSFSIFLFLTFVQLCSFGQKKNQNELGFVSDNDLYVSLFLDGYYTNGLKIFFKTATLKNNTKYIHRFSVGQNIYNAYKHNVPNLSEQDRPYAGYAFIAYSKTKTFKNRLFGYEVSFGFTGKNTKAREAQNFIHKLYNIEETEGWKFQIKQQFEPRITLTYIHNIYHQENSIIQASSIHKINLGTIFSNATTGIAFKLKNENYKNTPISNSIFYGTALNTENKTWIKENFFGVKSYVIYQFLDKTVTGNIYYNNLNKTFDIKPWVWHTDFGYYWNLKHWNISYHQIFHTNNVQDMRKSWIRYGTIALSYKF